MVSTVLWILLLLASRGCVPAAAGALRRERGSARLARGRRRRAVVGIVFGVLAATTHVDGRVDRGHDQGRRPGLRARRRAGVRAVRARARARDAAGWCSGSRASCSPLRSRFVYFVGWIVVLGLRALPARRVRVPVLTVAQDRLQREGRAGRERNRAPCVVAPPSPCAVRPRSPSIVVMTIVALSLPLSLALAALGLRAGAERRRPAGRRSPPARTPRPPRRRPPAASSPPRPPASCPAPAGTRSSTSPSAPACCSPERACAC